MVANLKAQFLVGLESGGLAEAPKLQRSRKLDQPRPLHKVVGRPYHPEARLQHAKQFVSAAYAVVCLLEVGQQKCRSCYLRAGVYHDFQAAQMFSEAVLQPVMMKPYVPPFSLAVPARSSLQPRS